ncbi:hypothetical protein CBL_03467 [Carabus blaptoides fortunei]
MVDAENTLHESARDDTNVYEQVVSLRVLVFVQKWQDPISLATLSVCQINSVYFKALLHRYTRPLRLVKNSAEDETHPVSRFEDRRTPLMSNSFRRRPFSGHARTAWTKLAHRARTLIPTERQLQRKFGDKRAESGVDGVKVRDDARSNRTPLPTMQAPSEAIRLNLNLIDGTSFADLAEGLRWDTAFNHIAAARAFPPIKQGALRNWRLARPRRRWLSNST